MLFINCETEKKMIVDRIPNWIDVEDVPRKLTAMAINGAKHAVDGAVIGVACGIFTIGFYYYKKHCTHDQSANADLPVPDAKFVGKGAIYGLAAGILYGIGKGLLSKKEEPFCMPPMFLRDPRF